MTRGGGRSVIAVVVATLAGSLVAGCGGEVTTAEASVGECFHDPDDASEVGPLDKAACDEPHDNEVISVFQLEGDEFPGPEEVRAEALQRCTEDFADYVGSTVEESDLELSMIVPTEERWEDEDDSEVICWVSTADGSTVDESVAGSAR